MKTSRKKLCRICFAIVLVLTLTLYCIVGYCEYQRGNDNHEHNFGEFIFWLAAAIAIAVILEEWVLYKCISYLWTTEVKTQGKTCFYIVLLIVDLAFLIRKSIIFLPSVYQMLFG